MNNKETGKTPIHSYSLFSVILGALLMLLIWPAMIPLALRDWQIKRGYRKRLPNEAGPAIVMITMSVPLTLILYAYLGFCWYYGTFNLAQVVLPLER